MEENISAPETQKSKLDSSRLFQQIFLCCSITGTLLLGFALGITLHFSISTFQTQLDDMLKTTALSLADSAMVREAYHQGYCTDEMIHYFDTLVDTADNMDVLTLSDCNLIRLYHVNHALIGEEFVGGDQGDALAGKSYFSDAIGTLGLQHRFLTPVRDTDGSILGFITVSATMTCISSLKKNIFSTYFWIALVLFLALGIISGIISLMVRRMLLGFTPQRLANTYLTQSEMLDSLDEGVVFVDPKGKVQLVNQAAENILGQKRSKLEGAPLDAILRTREETTLLDCTGENLSTSRPNVLANILVRDDQNKKPGLTLILKDKTEAVRKAEQLNGTQHIVTALRANNHEFMNRLQVIAGLLQIGRTQEALDYIGNVASIHSQAIGPIIQNIQNPSVAALLLGKANHAHELEIGLTLLSGSTLPPHSAYLSTNELVTVLGNLLGNAIEAVNAQGSGNSRSVAVQITEDEKSLLIVVSDTGIGIPQEMLSHIYDFGFSTKAAEGRGFGMSMIQNIVVRHDGTIDVDTEQGAGTTFTLIFQIKRQKEPVSAASGGFSNRRHFQQRSGRTGISEGKRSRPCHRGYLYARHEWHRTAALDSGRSPEPLGHYGDGGHRNPDRGRSSAAGHCGLPYQAVFVCTVSGGGAEVPAQGRCTQAQPYGQPDHAGPASECRPGKPQF